MKITARDIFKVLSLTAIFIGTIYLAYVARRELIWIGTAFFLAVALNPAVDKLTSFMPRRNRLLGTAAVFMILLALVSILLVVFVPPLVRQSEQLAKNLPRYTEDLARGHSFVAEQVRQNHLVDRIRSSQDQLISYVSSASGSFFSILRSLFSSFIAGITILGLTFFMLLEAPNWIKALWTLVPKKRQVRSRMLVERMYAAVTGYVTGNLLTSLVSATVVAITLAIIHVPYAIPLGILVGIFDLLPLVGATIGAIIVVMVTLISTGTTPAIIMAVFFLIYQQVENHVLQPIVYGRTVQMSPLLVLVSILLGASIGGIIGAFVAIPVAASIQIVVRDMASRRITGKN